MQGEQGHRHRTGGGNTDGGVALGSLLLTYIFAQLLLNLLITQCLWLYHAYTLITEVQAHQLLWNDLQVMTFILFYTCVLFES